MKKFLILTVFLSLPSLAWGQQFDPDAAYYRSMNELHQQEMARAAQQYQDEAPQRAFNVIHAQGDRNMMEQDIESNRNEVNRMKYGY